MADVCSAMKQVLILPFPEGLKQYLGLNTQRQGVYFYCLLMFSFRLQEKLQACALFWQPLQNQKFVMKKGILDHLIYSSVSEKIALRCIFKYFVLSSFECLRQQRHHPLPEGIILQSSTI